MRKILSIMLCVGLMTYANAQQTTPTVLATAGGSTNGKTISLSWTIGEIAIRSLSTSKGMLTEGFHQPLLLDDNMESINTSLELENSNQDYSLEIFAGPNPVQSLLNIQINSNLQGLGQIDLHNFQGQIQQSHRINLQQDHIEINMQNLVSGMYTISLYTMEGELLKTLKINKVEL